MRSTLQKEKEPYSVRLERKSYPSVWFVNETSIFRDNYPAKWNEELVRFLVEMFTDPDELVGDFMCGAGTAPIEARKLGRRGVGSDINSEAIKLARVRADKAMGNPGSFEVCDASNISYCVDGIFDLVLVSPPFGNSIDTKHDNYSELSGDIGNSKTMEQWAQRFKPCLAEFFRKTKPGRLCIIEIRPRRVNWESKPLWDWIYHGALDAGFRYFDMIVEIQQPYSKFPQDMLAVDHRKSYPMHSFLMIFQRPEFATLGEGLTNRTFPFDSRVE